MQHKVTVLVLMLFISSVSWGRNYYFRHYTNESGLSHNTVFCSLQDQQGFMWFGTKDGLNRFDGHSFKLYQHESENNRSIRSNYVISLHEDTDGMIWVGTNNGLCYYNPHTDDFSNLDSLFRYSGSIGDIQSDSRQNIWFQSFDGLFKYNKELNQLMHYPSQNSFTPIHICISSSGIPWFTSSEKALFKYDPQNDSFIKYEILTPEEKNIFSGISTITDTKDYGLLIGTDKLGLKLFDPTTESVQTILKADKYGKPIHFRVVLPYTENEYWIGSESGLYMFNIKTGEIKNFRKSLTDPYALGDNAIYTLTKDTEGGIWAGTYFQGISYLPNEYASFEKFFDQGDASTGIRGDVMREITGDKYGNIWIGTEDAGLNKYDPRTGQFTHFMPSEKPGSISGTNLHGLMAHGDTLWIGYFDKGVDLLHIPSGKLLNHFEAGYKLNDLKTNFVITIYRTKEGRILLGTLSGVYEYNTTSGNFTYRQDLSPYSFVYTICESYNNTLWVGSLDNGLFFRNPDGTTGYYKCNENDSNSLSSNFVSNIFEDSKRRLWIATRGNGFCEFHPETKTFTRYSVKNGLPSNFIYKILEDVKGNLWITTSNGLICFNPETKSMKRYSKSDGIMNNQFNYNSGYIDKLGKMYFGTIKGLIAFSPENIMGNTFSPPVYITGFQVFNEDINLRTPLKQSIAFINKIVLPYDQSTFSIDFAALSYISPEMNEYMYMLEGADKHWTYLKTYRKAYYTNLRPGEYLFHLKANNGNGQWTEKEKTLRIVIKPPFWQTGWAYMIYSLIIGGLGFIMLKFYTQRITLQNELKIEKMEDLKQKEILHAKIEFFTTIAHEIRTPLTLIKGPLDRILKNKDDMKTNEDNLFIMQKNTNRLLDLTNQLLDFRKTEIEGIKLNFIQVDIGKLLHETYIRFTPVAEEKNLKFSLSCNPEHLEAMVDREALTKILSNLFTNALKFADKCILVQMESLADRNNFTIRVSNDGPVIPEDVKEKIFELFYQYREPRQNSIPKGTGIGLYLARSLAELHGGKLYLDTNNTNLNSFVVELPVAQDIYITLDKDEKESSAPEEENDQPDNNTPDIPSILVVEDEKDMRHYIANELAGNYRVLRACNGKDALEILNKHIINLIVSDILMPKMDGFEFCKIIKSNINYSHIPVILLTARQDIQAQIKGLEEGADAYIVKPFSSDHLLAQISNLLKNREQLMKTFAQSPLVYSNTIALTKADEEFLKILNDTILERLSDPGLNVEYLTSVLGISTSSLYRKIKGICSMNPNEYIRVTRLKKAAELLIEENMAIKEVAYLTGFSAPSYFSSSFQKQFGMKPSEFIAKNATRI